MRMALTRFLDCSFFNVLENYEVGQIRKRGCPMQKPRGASKWQTTNEKYLGMYNTGRPSNFRLGLRSPTVERNNRKESRLTMGLQVCHFLQRLSETKLQKLTHTSQARK